MPQGPPYTLPNALPALVVGRARNVTLQIRNSDGTAATNYTTSTTLAATLWSGDKTTAAATPTVVWLNSSAAAGQVQVQFAATDTATLSAGDYYLEVTGTTSGSEESLILVGLPLVDAAGSSTGNTLDLVTLAAAQAQIGSILPADLAAIATLITAASVAVQRYCRRWFNQQTFIEIHQPKPGLWDKNQADLIVLNQYPVIGMPDMRGGLVNALNITNTDGTTNQEAYVGFTTSGDPQVSLTNTGLSLVRVASGTKTTSAVPWTTTSPYTTIGSVASTINALGNGWSASVQQASQNNLGAYLLYGSTANANALQSSGPGAMLLAFSTPLQFAGVEPDTGCVWLPPGLGYGAGYGAGYGYGVGYGSDWMFTGGSSPGGGTYRPPVLCSYTAGYSTIPQDLQIATCLVVQSLIQETQTDSRYKSETIGGVSVTLADSADRVIPAAARKLLSTYRAHREK